VPDQPDQPEREPDRGPDRVTDRAPDLVPGHIIDRRTFLKGVGAATLAGAQLDHATAAEPNEPASPAPSGAGPSGAEPDQSSPLGPLGQPGPPSARPDRVVYRGEHLRAVAMPLGGIGAGSIALAGDGGLRQWQMVHNVNHLAHVPGSFFGVWARRPGAESVARVLQSAENYDDSRFQAPPRTSNDHLAPAESRRLLEALPGVKQIEYAGEYPMAELGYHDPQLPVEVSLTAYSPFIPLNAKDSGLPAIVFEFRLKNPGTQPVAASVLATQQNFVGWDGGSAIEGVEYFAYGGNRNTLERSVGLTAIDMENPRLPGGFPFQGRVALAALDDDATFVTQWDHTRLLWDDFAEDGRLENTEGAASSQDGRTWNGALAVQVELKPGEERTVTFVLAWYFPNRYVNWDQSGMTVADRKSRLWLGVMYSNWFKSAMDAARYVAQNHERLARETRLFRDTFYDSTLPYALLDAVSSQASIIRTPTGIWLEDGGFHGFEGCCGASTGHCGGSGCCPLNCTHVWGYEQSLAHLFPELERTMRRTDWEVQQSPEGYVFTRTALPAYLPRPWEMKTPVEERVALDGMISTVLKTYREYRQGGGREWLLRYWPNVKRCVDYTQRTFDPGARGVIEGEQYNTYDISIYGLNTFIGGYYLAALRAAEEMGGIAGDEATARRYHQIYEQGRQTLASELWNGEYYVQKVDMEKYPKYEYGPGCLSDQLLGQWWAHQLDLGYILPPEQVATAALSIARYNWRDNFRGFKQDPRPFASDDDPGLLICSWPKGGRPAVPTLYSDEIWTGMEYQVAALLIQEGHFEAALKIVLGTRRRYDGRQRSPWNDIECGDHYARAMSSWSMLEAASGQRTSAPDGFLAFAPRSTPERFRSFFISAEGWGTFDQTTSEGPATAALHVAYGQVRLRAIELALAVGSADAIRRVSGSLNGQPVEIESRAPGPSGQAGKTVRLEPSAELVLKAGDTLRVSL